METLDEVYRLLNSANLTNNEQKQIVKDTVTVLSTNLMHVNIACATSVYDTYCLKKMKEQKHQIE